MQRPRTSGPVHVPLTRLRGRQIIEIPPEFELPGTHVRMRKAGDQLIIEPIIERPSLLELLATLEPLDEVLPPIEDLPPEEFHDF